MANFPGVQNSSVIYDLQLTPRPNSGVEINDIVTEMFLYDDVNTWTDTLLNLDMPNYYLTYGAIVIQMLSLTVEDDRADEIIEAMADLFSYPPEEYEFMTTYYVPEVISTDFQLY